MICHKLPFDDKSSADKAIKNLRSRKKGYTGHTYKCDTCGKFHYTKLSKSISQRIKQKAR